MVKVWKFAEGVPTHVGVGHAGVVTNVRVSPDGRILVSTSVDGGIYLWRFPHDDDLGGPRSGRGSTADADRDDASGRRDRQTDRARQLSLKKSAPARPENINNLSGSRTARSATDVATGSGGGGGDDAASAAGGSSGRSAVAVAPDAVDGSVKCLCPRDTACSCSDDRDTGNAGRKCKSSSSSLSSAGR